MVNLLEYRPLASYAADEPEANEHLSGREAYQRYGVLVTRILPSRRAFLDVITRPDYVAAAIHREAGLERTALLCCSAGTAA